MLMINFKVPMSMMIMMIFGVVMMIFGVMMMMIRSTRPIVLTIEDGKGATDSGIYGNVDFKNPIIICLHPVFCDLDVFF